MERRKRGFQLEKAILATDFICAPAQEFLVHRTSGMHDARRRSAPCAIDQGNQLA